MSDGDRLFEAVLVDPDSDAPRLVYADWLSERGDPRGLFIRLQCAGKDDRQLRLARKMLKHHESAWVQPFKRFVESWEWERGFVDYVEAKAAAFMPHLASIAAVTPIQYLFLDSLSTGEFRALATHPMAKGLRTLSASLTLEADTFYSEQWCGLRSLGLLTSRGGDTGLIGLANAPLKALETLSVGSTGSTDVGFQALCNAAFFSRLTSLHVRGRLTRETYELIGRAGIALQRLGLFDHAPEQGLEALMAAPGLGSLTELTVDSCTDAQLKMLFASPRLPKLESVTRRTNAGYTREHRTRAV